MLNIFASIHVGRRDVVSILLRRGANVNIGNNDNDTPLILAADKGIHQSKYEMEFTEPIEFRLFVPNFSQDMKIS